MSSDQTLIPHKEDEKVVSEPMNETIKPVEKDPIEEVKENPCPIKGSDESVNYEGEEVVEEEKRDGILDTQLKKDEISDAQSVEEDFISELKKGDKDDPKLEESGISEGKVDGDEKTGVKGENKAEKIDGPEERDLVFDDKEAEDEKVGVEEDRDVKIEPKIEVEEDRDVKMEPKIGVDEDSDVKIEPKIGVEEDNDENPEEKDVKIEPEIEKGNEEREEIKKSSPTHGGENGEKSDEKIEKDETSLPSTEIEPEKGQEEEEIEASEVKKDGEVKETETPNPKFDEIEEREVPNPKIDEIEESEVPNPKIEESEAPNPKIDEIEENEAPNPKIDEIEESEAPNPNPSSSIVEEPTEVEEAKPDLVESVPVIDTVDTNTSVDNGFAKDEISEGISVNSVTKEVESDVNSSPIKGENHEIDEIKENSESNESIDEDSSESSSDGEKFEEMIGISENNVTREIEGNENYGEIMGEINETEEVENGNSAEFIGEEDGQIVTDSDEERESIELEEEDEDVEEDRDYEEEDEDEDEQVRQIFDSDALAALLRAATGGTDTGTGTGAGSRILNFDRPAGLGASVPVLRPSAPRTYRPNPNSNTELSPVPVVNENQEEEEMSPEERTLHEKIENIRVKFLRLVYRSGHSPDDTVAAQVLYRLSLAEGIRRGRTGTRTGTTERARRTALQLENSGTESDLDFSCNILVLGKTGVGKSATINSIFNNEVTGTSAFVPATKSVREITGKVDGIQFRVIDTPGLKSSVMDQNWNRKILSSIKSYTKKCPPDIVLYIDRMDTQTRDLNDLPLLRTITSVLGSAIWFNAIVCLTHAGSAPPDGPNGTPLTYEVFVAQRSHVVQQMVRQAAGDMRLMNPVSLIENHHLCRRNTSGSKVLPNGTAWRQQLLLLCYSSKILSEANGLLKLQDASSSVASKLFGFRFRSPPLPFLLSSLLQTRTHPKLVNDNGGDGNGDSDLEIDDFLDEDDDEEDEYDLLPTFKPLKKAQIERLTKEQRKAYFEEYEYRVKLLQKKQWREELRRMKEMKKRAKENNTGFNTGTGIGTGMEQGEEEFDQDNAPASVPVPLPDMVLPPSFDSDGYTYRYRFLEPSSGFLARPVLDTHGWDHDVGYDGVSLEETLTLINKFPANATVQITKDKKEFSIHLESSVSAKHGDNGLNGSNGSSLLGFDIQTIGRQLGYILRGETKFKNLKRNKTTGGVTLTFLGDIVALGTKLEDQINLGKRVSLVGSTGFVRAQGDTAYGANLEARLRDKDYPIGQSLTTLGLSLMKWRGDLAIGANLQSQIPIGFGSKVALRVGLNNKLSGQVTVRTSTSDQVQIAFLGLVPVVMSIYRNYLGGGGGGESFAY